MSGITVTGAIVLALVAITIWVFAGGNGHQQPTTRTTPAAASPVCQTGGASNCVQGAQNLVQGLNSQTSTQSSTPATP